MPTDACVAFYGCKNCGETLKPLPGSCCVFCSYGSVPCPPIQEGVEPRCTPKPDQSPKDWVGSTRTSLLAWWLPSATIVAGLFAPIPTPTVIWSVALAWMGIACVLNARQCGRTHCRYSGPYYLAMIVPVAVVGLGIAPLSPYGWVAWEVSFSVAAISSGGPLNVRGANSLRLTFTERQPSAGAFLLVRISDIVAYVWKPRSPIGPVCEEGPERGAAPNRWPSERDTGSGET
jgi:hypothetical protein